MRKNHLQTALMWSEFIKSAENALQLARIQLLLCVQELTEQEFEAYSSQVCED